MVEAEVPARPLLVRLLPEVPVTLVGRVVLVGRAAWVPLVAIRLTRLSPLMTP